MPVPELEPVALPGVQHQPAFVIFFFANPGGIIIDALKQLAVDVQQPGIFRIQIGELIEVHGILLGIISTSFL
jgi:hypothetical protein